MIAIGYLDLKYLPNTMNIVSETAVAQAYLWHRQWRDVIVVVSVTIGVFRNNSD